MTADWLKWGAYATSIVESGTDPGSGAVGWNVIESYFNDSQGSERAYGGGIGCIQITSDNFAMLLDMYNEGVDFSSLPSGMLKSDLAAGTPSVNYAASTGGGGTGVFSGAECYALKYNILNSTKAKEVQQKWIQNYFLQKNADLTNMIDASGLDTASKAMLTNLEVQAPADVAGVLSPPAPGNLAETTADIKSWVGYDGRQDTVSQYLAGITDFSAEPPYDFFSGDSSTTTSSNTSPKPTQNKKLGGDSNGKRTTKAPDPVDYLKLKSGLFIQNTNYIRQMDSRIQLRQNIRDNQYIFNIDNQGAQTASNQDAHKAAPKPAPQTTPPSDPAPRPTSSDLINSFMAQVTQFPQGFNDYNQVRPQGDVASCGYCDCSGFIGWCCRNIEPGLWNGGNCNTSTIYQYASDNGLIVAQGSLATVQAAWQYGDIIDMGTGGAFDEHICARGTGTIWNCRAPWGPDGGIFHDDDSDYSAYSGGTICGFWQDTLGFDTWACIRLR